MSIYHKRHKREMTAVNALVNRLAGELDIVCREAHAELKSLEDIRLKCMWNHQAMLPQLHYCNEAWSLAAIKNGVRWMWLKIAINTFVGFRNLMETKCAFNSLQFFTLRCKYDYRGHLLKTLQSKVTKMKTAWLMVRKLTEQNHTDSDDDVVALGSCRLDTELIH